MSGLEWVAIYGAVTGTISLLATMTFKGIEIWRDRPGVGVKASTIGVPIGDQVEFRLGISAFGRRRPATVTGAGVILDGLGKLTWPLQPISLTEGQRHTFEMKFESIRRALEQNPLAKPPEFAFVEALGETYKVRLGSLEQYYVTGRYNLSIRGRFETRLNRLLPWRRAKFAAAEAAIARQWGT